MTSDPREERFLMGARGPAPEPNEIKRRKGNPGQRPLPDLADVVHLAVIDGVPEPPRSLSTPGKQAWESVFEGPARNWIGESDLLALQLWCEMVDDYVLLRSRLYQAMKGDVDYTTPTWRLRKQVLELAREVMAGARQFGFTPSGRAELGVAEVRVAEGAARVAGLLDDPPERDFRRIIDV